VIDDGCAAKVGRQGRLEDRNAQCKAIVVDNAGKRRREA